MGLYSTNRAAAVAVQSESVETPVAVDESIESLIESIDWTPDYNIGSVLELCIALNENDAKMFDTLIECDFVSANNNIVMEAEEAEQANSAADTTKKEKIGEKIAKVVKTVIEWIKKAASNAINKITELLHKDKKLVEMYGKTLTMDNLKGFKGIPDFDFPGEFTTKDGLAAMANSIKYFAIDAQKAQVKERLDTVMENFKKKIEEAHDKVREDLVDAALGAGIDYDMNKDKVVNANKGNTWMPTADQLKTIQHTVAAGSIIIGDIKKLTAEIVKILTDLERESKKMLGNSTKASEYEVYQAKVIYDFASTSCKELSKTFQTYNYALNKQLAAHRKAFIICGRYALSASKKGAKDTEDVPVEKVEGEVVEAAMLYALGEASDMYVMEALGY